MADPQYATRVLPDREPRLRRMLRELSDAQTGQWRFRLFGPLTCASVHTADRPAMPAVTKAAAKPILAFRLR